MAKTFSAPMRAPAKRIYAILTRTLGNRLRGHSRRALCGLVSIGLVFPAAATKTWAAGPSKPGAMQQVAGACQEEAARFCSGADPGVDEPVKMDSRDVFICLRVQTTSISPTCRKAINDAKQ